MVALADRSRWAAPPRRRIQGCGSGLAASRRASEPGLSPLHRKRTPCANWGGFPYGRRVTFAYLRIRSAPATPGACTSACKVFHTPPLLRPRITLLSSGMAAPDMLAVLTEFHTTVGDILDAAGLEGGSCL